MDDFYFIHTVSPEIINYIFIGFFVFFLTIASFVLIAQYLLFGISIYKVAVLQGISKPWMAWIPFTRSYLFGKIGDYLKQKSGHHSKRKLLLLILSFVKVIFSIIFIGLIIKIAYDITNFVYSIMGDTSVFSLLQMVDEDALINVIFTYFSDFIFLLISFVFLLIFYIWFMVVNMKNYNLLFKEYAVGSAGVFTAIAIVSYLFFIVFIPPLLLLVLLRKRLSLSGA